MKNKIFFFFKTSVMALLAVAGGILASCSDNTGSVDVSGDCTLKSFVLNDTLVANINPISRVVKMKVPVDFTEKSDMVVTGITFSEGAKSSINLGDHLDMSADQVLLLKNGSIASDWKLMVRNDEARILGFTLEGITGSIDQENKIITVSVSATSGIDLTKAKFSAVLTDDAVITSHSTNEADFSDPENPVKFTVVDRTATTVYTVQIILITDPEILVLGENANVEELYIEEKVAVKWITGNMKNAVYASWKDIIDQNIPLEKVKVVFWHRHTGIYGNFPSFRNSEKGAMDALEVMKNLYQRGVGFVLSRAAVNYAAALGAMPEDACPNNCWGGDPGEGDPAWNQMGDDPWHFFPYNAEHPLWQGLKKGPDPNGIYTLDKGYTICNSTAQYGFWDDYQDGNEAVNAKTGGCVLGGSGNVSSWELKNYNEDPALREFGKGGVICFGSGLIDWNSPTEYTCDLHENLYKIMQNAVDYLSK